MLVSSAEIATRSRKDSDVSLLEDVEDVGRGTSVEIDRGQKD